MSDFLVCFSGIAYSNFSQISLNSSKKFKEKV